MAEAALMFCLLVLVGCGHAFEKVVVDLAQETEAELTFRRKTDMTQVVKHKNDTSFDWVPACFFNSLGSRFQKLHCGEGGLTLTVLLTGVTEKDAGDYICHQGSGAGPQEPGCGVTLVVKAAPPASPGLSPGQIAGIVLGVIILILLILLVIDIARCHFKERGVVWRLKQTIQGWCSSR